MTKIDKRERAVARRIDKRVVEGALKPFNKIDLQAGLNEFERQKHGRIIVQPQLLNVFDLAGVHGWLDEDEADDIDAEEETLP